MSNILIKKNLKSKKGKQRWSKNLDVNELQEQIIKQNDENYNKKRKNLKPLEYVIEALPEKGKRQKLSKDRFKKITNEENIKRKSFSERNQIEKITHFLKKQDKKQENEDSEEIDSNNNNQNENELTTLSKHWIDNLEEQNFDNEIEKKTLEKKKKILSKKPNVSRIVIPFEGMSYNPSFKAHQELIDNLIQTSDIIYEERKKQEYLEREQNRILLNKNAIKSKPKPLRFKSEKEKLLYQEYQKVQKERQHQHQFTLIKKFKKEIEQEQQQRDQKKLLKQQVEEEEKLRNQLGYIHRPPKLSKHNYKMITPQFQMEDQIADNLRNLESKQSDLIRESFDSIFRRGFIEKRDQKKKQKRSIPTYKTYEVHSKKERGDEWENIEKEIKILN